MPKQPLSCPVVIPDRPVFVEFEGEDFYSVPGYHRNLPHWRLKGATYFVTFRLADSIPMSVIAAWQQDEAAWLNVHGICPDWRQKNPKRYYTMLSRVPRPDRQRFERAQARKFFLELDQCHGQCALKIPAASRSVADALQYFHGKRLWVGDYVIMPNHVHVIVQMFEGCPLEEWLYSVKRFSARMLLKDEQVKSQISTRSGHVWQTESFDRVIRDKNELRRTRKYIENNPGTMKPGTFVHHRGLWLDQLD